MLRAGEWKAAIEGTREKVWTHRRGKAPLLGRGQEEEQAAIKNGMKKIQEDGIEKALSGITTLDEVHRTVFFDEL